MMFILYVHVVRTVNLFIYVNLIVNIINLLKIHCKIVSLDWVLWDKKILKIQEKRFKNYWSLMKNDTILSLFVISLLRLFIV